jgi:soluble lytic murein transglycosylase-like protein
MTARTPSALLGALLLCLGLLAGCGGGSTDEPGDAAPSTPGTSSPANAQRGDQGADQPSGPHPVLAAAVEDGPVRPTSPRQAAQQIRVAEQAITSPRTSPEVLAAAGKVQQLAYRELGSRPAWDAAVRRALPRRLHRVVELNVSARRELRSMHPASTLSDTLPAWRIVEPAPAPRLMRFYRQAERTFGVDWEVLAAVNLVETVFGRIRGTSVAGAQGPMQFMPATWEAYGKGNVDNPRDAIMAAGRYLSAMGFADDRSTALRRYNNSQAYVDAVLAHAEVMKQRPRAFFGYHQWDVWFLTSKGEVMLPVGYEETEPVPVEEHLDE